MLVPRVLRLKGVRETQRPGAKLATPSTAGNHDTLVDVDAMQGISTEYSHTAQEDANNPVSAPATRGSKWTVAPVTPQYPAQLVAGIELIFSDYAHQEEARAGWLRQHYRTVDGEDKFVHLAAILENPNIATLKPQANYVLLQQALRQHPSDMLELSSNGYYVRRLPSSYPPKFLPHNSFDQVDDDGLSFWDQRTIYVEPHLRTLSKTPAKVAHWLREHGQLKPKWLPIQAVHTLYPSCAFVVLSATVTHEHFWAQWTAAGQPDGWKIMTKVEHTKRTAEYLALLDKVKPNSKGKSRLDDPALPPVARPSALAPNVDVVPEYADNIKRPKNKRKRNRKKGDRTDAHVGEAKANSTYAADDKTQADELCRERRA